jgi:hypothetical protein
MTDDMRIHDTKEGNLKYFQYIQTFMNVVIKPGAQSTFTADVPSQSCDECLQKYSPVNRR